MTLLLLLVNHHIVNMGCKGSKPKLNKEIDKQKVCKAGIALGRNSLKLEGNFQMGYVSKTEKRYKPIIEPCGTHTGQELERDIVSKRQLYTIKEENDGEEESIERENNE